MKYFFPKIVFTNNSHNNSQNRNKSALHNIENDIQPKEDEHATAHDGGGFSGTTTDDVTAFNSQNHGQGCNQEHRRERDCHTMQSPSGHGHGDSHCQCIDTVGHAGYDNIPEPGQILRLLLGKRLLYHGPADEKQQSHTYILHVG